MRRRALVLLAGCSSPPVTTDVPVLDAALVAEDTARALDAAAPVDATSDAGPPIALACADAYAASVCSGTADPTALGSGIEPVRTGIIAGDPGSHYYCRPADAADWNGRLLLHLVGTYSDPLDDNRFPERACSLGYAAIAPMYENRDDARSTCEEDAACYDAYHAEIVTGVEGSPVEVDADDSIVSRSRSLLDALASSDAAFPGWATVSGELDDAAWPSVVVSGHSQGSGHALYIARDREVQRLVILAGPADQLRDGEPDHAPPPWITELATRTVTPVERFFAYIHLDDSIERIPQVFASWDTMGLGTACDYARTGGYDAGCRRILIPADDCLGLNAHSTVVVRTWGPMCRLGAMGSDNVATWAFLLE
jgi:hypothetical protein